MTDTNKSAATVENSKSKKELKQEKIDQKYKQKLEQARLATIAKTEKKIASLKVKLEKEQRPKLKTKLQNKIEEQEKILTNLKDAEKAEVKRPAGLVVKTWSAGLVKESSRVTWYKKKETIRDFIIVLIVSAFLAIIFFALDMIIMTIRK